MRRASATRAGRPTPAAPARTAGRSSGLCWPMTTSAGTPREALFELRMRLAWCTSTRAAILTRAMVATLTDVVEARRVQHPQRVLRDLLRALVASHGAKTEQHHAWVVACTPWGEGAGLSGQLAPPPQQLLGQGGAHPWHRSPRDPSGARAIQY
jgi:hypothetical protein